MKKQNYSKRLHLKFTHQVCIVIISFFVLSLSSFTPISISDDLSNSKNPGDDETVIYIYRLKSMVGGAVAWTIFIQEYDAEKNEFLPKKKIGKLKQKQYMPITVKANTMYYIEVGTMQKILVLGKENAKLIVQLKGNAIKATAMDNYALIKLGAGQIVGATNLVEGIIQISINKSNQKKFEEKEFIWLEPTEDNPDYKEMQQFENCMK